MRLRPSITSHCILSAYLLSAALLSTVVVANPIPISSRTTDARDVRIRLAWRNPGEENFRSVSRKFTATDRFSLVMTEKSFSIGFEIQDSTSAKHTEIIKVDLPRMPSGRIIDAALKDLGAGNEHLIAHFIDLDFFNQHYAVIRNVDRLRTETNALLKKKAEEHKDFTIGDPEFQDPIDIIRDDLDWINTVLLYLTLINQPESGVPVLDPKELVEWTKIFKEMTSMRRQVKQ
ncbi:hypothetical protein GGU10DRAFT_364798 [Lentinula aff. detonsa]|uniref:Uncharacterized protein n=1 Tax=Lentinula aff. detonsa TaxID=2804958 RepID=A0AA38K8H9_9AGAR|nr:hypothetical protein GGU10DRAFT_364798 [Lentinula aff. detonsa]